MIKFGQQVQQGSKGPVGPTLDLRQVYNQIPFVHMPMTVVPKARRNIRNGRGMLVWVAGPHGANVPFVVTHNLGRYAQGAIMISNNDLQAFTRYVAFTHLLPDGVRTLMKQSIACDLTVQLAYIWMF